MNCTFCEASGEPCACNDGRGKLRSETWEQYVIRLAAKQQLKNECLSAYMGYLRSGDSEPEAARCALYDWDI